MKKKNVLLLIGLFFLVAGEFFLRTAFGFTDAVLFREDPQMEYVAEPMQDRQRFGNSVKYNEFSMRSDPLRKDSRRILGLGDSILNGGVLCDQDALATYLLELKFQKELSQNIQVLNISAPSWGPDNVMAYLEKFGNFNAEFVFLVTSSHDAFDTMDFTQVVGTNKNYPNKQYPLAYAEGVDRYLFPWLVRKFKGKKEAFGGYDGTPQEKIFNTGFQAIFQYTKKQKIPFLLYLHPELSEVKKGSFNKKGQFILEFAKRNNIIVITGLQGAHESHYIDDIHLNEKGQLYLFEQLYPQMKEMMFSKN